MTPAMVKYANGTEFAVRLGYANCPLTYHFRAYKGEVNYNAIAENIICGTGKIKITGIPTGSFQYKLQGPASSLMRRDILLPTGEWKLMCRAFMLPVMLSKKNPVK